ncbi:MAG: hypothetical protein P8018_11110 [Acidobacteriota bacterium]
MKTTSRRQVLFGMAALLGVALAGALLSRRPRFLKRRSVTKDNPTQGGPRRTSRKVSPALYSVKRRG